MTIKTFQRLLCFMTATPDFGLALEVLKNPICTVLMK